MIWNKTLMRSISRDSNDRPCIHTFKLSTLVLHYYSYLLVYFFRYKILVQNNFFPKVHENFKNIRKFKIWSNKIHINNILWTLSRCSPTHEFQTSCALSPVSQTGILVHKHDINTPKSNSKKNLHERLGVLAS